MLRRAIPLLAISAVLLPLPARAGPSPSLGVQLGQGRGHYQRAEGVWDSGALWHYETAAGNRWEASVELGVARWQARDPSRQHAWQLSAIPMLRWWPGQRLFVEMGIGPTLFDTTRVGGRSISTAFQFGDHLGIGLQVDERNSVSLRYSHYSNASIKKPNPGLDLLQLSWRMSY